MSTRITQISDNKRICVQCTRPNIKKCIKGNCLQCYHRKWKFKNPEKVKELNKKWSTIHNPRRIVFKGRSVLLKENPRKGICSKCGAVKGKDCKNTIMHHEKYIESDVLAHTVEVCTRCHNKIHWKLRKKESKKLDEREIK